MRNQFPAAPWSRLLKATSIGTSLLLVGAGYAVARTVPAIGALKFVSLAGACSLPAIALIALLFVVISFEIDGNQLRIRRLLWHTRIDLTTVQEARMDPSMSQDTTRTAGNGGLFSFTGYYRNPSLGRYEAYVTDWKQTVVVRLAHRVIVVSPADPAQLIGALQAAFPGLSHAPRGKLS